MDRHGVRGQLRGAVVDRCRARRPVRSTADDVDRARRVRAGLGGCGVGLGGRHVDRVPRPAGRGRSDHPPDRPDDRHVGVSAESPRDGDRRPRRCHRAGGDRGAGRGRCGLALVAVAVDLLDQRAGRAGRDPRRPGRRRGDLRSRPDDRPGRTGARVDGGHRHGLGARSGERRRMGERRVHRRGGDRSRSR